MTGRELTDSSNSSFDKWAFIRRLQLLTLVLSIFAGAVHLFEVKILIGLFEYVPSGFRLPIISDWISRVSLTYGDLAGLGRVLQFTWLAILITVFANLVVALPELRRKPVVLDPLDDEMTTVDHALHRNLYHSWFHLHFDNSAFAKSKEQSTPQKTSHSQISERSIASLIVANVHRPPAIGYLCLAVGMVLYFWVSSDASFTFINRKSVYVSCPILITAMGMLITEVVIYIFSAIFSFVDDK